MASRNFAGNLAGWAQLGREVGLGHSSNNVLDLAVVSETQLQRIGEERPTNSTAPRRFGEAKQLPLPHCVGFIHAFRPPRENTTGMAGGGVSILWNKNRCTVREVDKHLEGAICARVEKPGRAPFHLLGVYLPTEKSAKAEYFEELIEWLRARITAILKSDAPYVVLAGDFNCSIGRGHAGWSRLTDDATPPTPRDRLFLAFLVGCNLVPVHGMNGHIARFTCQTARYAYDRGGRDEDFGRRERDYIFVLAQHGPTTVPLRPRMGDPWGPAHCHREVSALIEVPGGGPTRNTLPKLPRRDQRPFVPDYSDLAAYDRIAMALETHSTKLEQQRVRKASARDMFNTVQDALRAVAKEQCQRPKHATSPPMRVVRHDPAAPAAHARRAVPTDVVDLLRIARRLLTRSGALRRKGHKGAIAAADALRAKWKVRHKEAEAALRRFRKGEPDRHTQELERDYKRSSTRWFKDFADDAADSYSSAPPLIPCNEDGHPEDTFPAEARSLFEMEQPDPPAIKPESGDTYLRHVPRPRIPLPPGGALGAAFTWQEVWWVLFGHTRHAPPVPCEHSTTDGGPTTCSHCKEEAAQFAAAERGEAEALGRTSKTSVACGIDGVPPEILAWARHKDYDPTNDDADGGHTTRMRKAYCRALTHMFNEMLTSGTVPEGFAEAIVSLLRKETKVSGEAPDFSRFSAYRTISCITTTHKVLALVIERRMSHFRSAAGLLGPQQAGFSHRLATEHDLFVALETLRREIHVKDGGTWALFADIRRAYDTVNHAALIKVLETIGIAPNMCTLIRALLAGTSFRMDINGGLTEPIALKVGLPQGSPLSPVLFLFFIESLCRSLDAADVERQSTAAAETGRAGVGAATPPLPPLAAFSQRGNSFGRYCTPMIWSFFRRRSRTSPTSGGS